MIPRYLHPYDAQPFTEDQTCPKCDSPDEPDFDYMSTTPSNNNFDRHEWIERTCRRCGFRWQQKCADADKKDGD